MTDWDAARYDRVSDPQVEWGRRVIDRLAPKTGERLLDLGCGTGRLTTQIGALVPGGMVLGLDRSKAMLEVAARPVPALGSQGLAGKLRFVLGDGAALPFSGSLDAVFSTATLHWIGDHHAVFRSVFDALRQGGRFVSQCGGGHNLLRLYTRASDLMRSAPYARFFDGWQDPWHFAFPEETSAALDRAGFVNVSVWLESTPATFRDPAAYSEFISCVCIRHHLARLPQDVHARFASELTRAAESDDPPLTLDYWRLNINARRPSA